MTSPQLLLLIAFVALAVGCGRQADVDGEASAPQPSESQNVPLPNAPTNLLPDFLVFARDNSATGCSGVIEHIVRNEFGGSISTSVAIFVAFIEEANENQPRRWDANVFLRTDVEFDLGPVPQALGDWLLAHTACDEPMDLNIHRGKNTDFLSFGETWFD